LGGGQYRRRWPATGPVDDCQWADRDSLRFLVYLAQRIEGLSVALVLAGRVPDSAETEAASLWLQLASRPSAVALLVEEPHFAVLQLLAVAIVVHVERGAIADALELARTGEALGIAEDRSYVPEFLIARGRLRLAQAQVREGVADLLWCGESRESRGVLWPNDWKAHAAAALASLGERATAAKLAREQLDMARSVGAPGALGLSLRAAGLATQGDERLALLAEAVSVLEPSASRLELAHALVELGSELSRTGQRREGRDVRRRAIKLADECGAVVLAERARAELHAGPGRRARTEADRAQRINRGGVARLSPGGGRAHQS
jgi:tetratricopeptide (TPR) repeat protein